jgi:hypothetical protein
MIVRSGLRAPGDLSGLDSWEDGGLLTRALASIVVGLGGQHQEKVSYSIFEMLVKISRYTPSRTRKCRVSVVPFARRKYVRLYYLTRKNGFSEVRRPEARYSQPSEAAGRILKDERGIITSPETKKVAVGPQRARPRPKGAAVLMYTMTNSSAIIA